MMINYNNPQTWQQEKLKNYQKKNYNNVQNFIMNKKKLKFLKIIKINQNITQQM